MTKTDVSVTVVIPAYNASRTIAATLKSVMAQTRPDWEAIVVDDRSTDDTCAVVEDLASRDSRIRLLALEKNNGAPAAPRNRGVENANSPWVAFLDSDDLWHPRKLELQLKVLAETNGSFSCTKMRDFPDGATVVDADVESPVKTRRIGFASHRVKGRIPASSVVVSTDLARKFPFEEDLSYKAVEDYHCWLRILHSGVPCIKLEEPLLNYRRIAGQISGSKYYMMHRIFNVHRNFERTPLISAAFFTGSHVLLALYLRLIKKGF